MKNTVTSITLLLLPKQPPQKYKLTGTVGATGVGEVPGGAGVGEGPGGAGVGEGPGGAGVGEGPGGAGVGEGPITA